MTTSPAWLDPYMSADQGYRVSPPPWPQGPGRSHSPHTDQLASCPPGETCNRVRAPREPPSRPMPRCGAATPPETSKLSSGDGKHQATHSVTQRLVCTPSKRGERRSLSKLTAGNSRLQSRRFVGHGITHKVRGCTKGQKRQEAAAGEGMMKYLETFARILYLPVCR